MPPLTDPDRLQAISDALSNWNCTGFIRLELSETAQDYLRDELGITSAKELGRLLFGYFASGGGIDEVPEVRPGWLEDWDYHHDFRLTINGRRVYVEVRLCCSFPFRPDESSILVVNIHDV